jgi:hypothetical protein
MGRKERAGGGARLAGFSNSWQQLPQRAADGALITMVPSLAAESCPIFGLGILQKLNKEKNF